MRKQLFDQAGMRDTTADPPPVDAEDDSSIGNTLRDLFGDARPKKEKAPTSKTTLAVNRATPYFPRYGADPKYGLHPMRPLHLSCYSGASVFIATPSDLVRFGLAWNSGKLLRRQTTDMLLSGEGLGWYVQTLTLAGKERRVVRKDGDVLGGNVASLLMVPDSDLVVAVTANISYANTGALALRVAEVFAGGQAPAATPATGEPRTTTDEHGSER